MGGSYWSDDFYNERVTSRKAKGVDTFDYDSKIRSGTAAKKCHPTLDINGKIRESRDSAAHPESVAIGVIFDVTGSMADVPRVMQKKLPQLMGLLLRKNYVKDPQILFGAVGDYRSDSVPLQIGQFESGVEMDDNLTNVFLEGGGGGSYEESYQTAMYYFAHRTSIDCFEKRGKKGYLFIIGDEKPYPSCTKVELEKVIGDGAQAAVSLEDIVKAVREKYNVFFIIPKGTHHGSDPVLRDCWTKLLGAENVLMLDNPEAVCETIGLAIGLVEGSTTADGMAADLAEFGAKKNVISAATNSLDGLAKSVALMKAGQGTLPAKGKADKTERL